MGNAAAARKRAKAKRTWLTTEEAGSLMGVSASTVRKWVGRWEEGCRALCLHLYGEVVPELVAAWALRQEPTGRRPALKLPEDAVQDFADSEECRAVLRQSEARRLDGLGTLARRVERLEAIVAELQARLDG